MKETTNFKRRCYNFIIQKLVSDFYNKFISWKTKNSLTESTCDEMLQLLSSSGITPLPKRVKSLCKTKNENFQSNGKSNMDYCYIGIKSNINNIIENLPSDFICNSKIINLSLNVDGVSCFRSSSKS